MDLFSKIKLIERLDHLIRKCATGSPRELSCRLAISERQVYNIINEMKDLGAPITYCNARKSYRYEDEVTFKFGFLLDNANELNNLKGGRRPLLTFIGFFDHTENIFQYPRL